MLSRLIPPTSQPIAWTERLRTAGFGGLAIGLTGIISSQFSSGPALMVMLASMGASTVILYCVPTSPMARAWPVAGGHLLSGLIGIGCNHLPLDQWIAAGLAVGLSIFAMHLTRCLHPPGGATTLVATLGSSPSNMGLQFLLTPLALNVAILLTLSSLFNSRWLTGRKPVVPAPRDSKDPPPLERLGIRRQDLQAALKEMSSFVDIGETELGELYDLAAAAALQRELGSLTCGDVMSRDMVTVEFGTELEHTWALMRQKRVKAAPVIDRARHVIGIVTLTDFFNHARIDRVDGIKEKVRTLLRTTPDTHSSKPEVAGQVMSHPVITLKTTTPAAELALLMSGRRIHQIPIVDGNDKLAGLVTETDLIAALYKSLKLGDAITLPETSKP
jgi:CBS domain-containing membrane protein